MKKTLMLIMIVLTVLSTCSFGTLKVAVCNPLPPGIDYTWLAGSVWPSGSPPGPQTARTIMTNITIPSVLPPYSDEFYYVLISVWDSAGSYNQLGFSCYNGVWGLTYSWTSGSPSNPQYHSSPNAMTLSLGVNYKFSITTQSEYTDFAVYQGSTKIWSLHAHTYGNWLWLQDTYAGYYGYTDYEEVKWTHFVQGDPGFDFYFFNQYWISTSGTAYATVWTPFLYSAPPGVTVTINGNSVLIDNPNYRGGGGCPYVATWNGTGYALDNNILPASETGNGTDTEDYYKLEQSLVPVFITRQSSFYSLQIREFEHEIDYIDQVKLMAVEHSQGTSIAVTPEGEILTYMNPTIPISCIDNHGVSRLGETGRMDGNVNDPSTYFQGYNDDWLLLNFGHVTGPCAKLILRDDQKCADICINVQVPNTNGGWQTVEVLHPRDFWAVEAVNLNAYIPANGNLVVRLLWTATHRLDYVGLDMSAPAQVQITSASPKKAVHSTMGDVTSKLLLDDEDCSELVNGQQLTLAFILPNKAQGKTRDFILYADGYYYTTIS